MPKTRGRPPIHHTKLILLALILKTFLKLSFRDTQDLLEDLTGFGYSDTYRLRWRRGKQIREVSAHVKADVLIKVVRDKKVVLGAKVDRACSYERKLLRELLKDMPFKAFYFLGDAYYSMESGLLKEIKLMGMVAIVPVKKSLRVKVRSQVRPWAKENSDTR